MNSSLFRLTSVSFPDLYLSAKFVTEDEFILYKDKYSVVHSTWKYGNGKLRLAYLDIEVSASFKKEKDAYKIKTDQGYIDAWDESKEVKEHHQTEHKNQMWKIEKGDPVIPHPEEIMKNWSPNKGILELQHQDYLTDFRLRQGESKIFHSFASPEKILGYLRHVPLVAVDADQHVTLSNMTRLESTTSRDLEQECLLSYFDRREARKMVIASRSLFFAKGGYGSPVALLPKPVEVILLSMTGAQFEFRHLEYQDFIVVKGDHEKKNPLFPSYYSNGVKPSFHIASDEKENIKIDDKTLLLSSAYRQAMVEDLFLVLFAFNSMIPLGFTGRLFLTAVGMGFFAKLEMQKSIRKYLLPLYLEAFEIIAKSDRASKLTKIRTVVFPDYFDGEYYPPGATNNKLGPFSLIHARNKDMFDIPFDGEVPGFVNPSDVFCYRGNEFKYSSVEAMIGNNSDLRYSQVLLFNPALGRSTNWIRVLLE